MRDMAKRRKISSEINITPFTDVVLVLLIIFMITTPLIIQTGIKVKLPDVIKAETEDNENITIMVDSKGNIFINDKKYAADELKNKLTAILLSQPYKTVIIKADKEIKYDTVINVIDIAKQSGARKFTLGVELKN